MHVQGRASASSPEPRHPCSTKSFHGCRSHKATVDLLRRAAHAICIAHCATCSDKVCVNCVYHNCSFPGTLRCKRAQGTNGISAEFFRYICTEVTEGNLACVLLSQSGLQAAASLTAVRADQATALPPEMMQITLAFVAKKPMSLDAGQTFGGPHARMLVHWRFCRVGSGGCIIRQKRRWLPKSVASGSQDAHEIVRQLVRSHPPGLRPGCLGLALVLSRPWTKSWRWQS